MYDNAKAYQVAAIISDHLDCSEFGENYISKLLLDDHGQCLHLTIWGPMGLEDMQTIAKAFGDPSFEVYPISKNEMKMVFCNNSHEELYTEAESVELSMNIPQEYLKNKD